MNNLQIITTSFKESFKPKRFLPFFLLYFIGFVLASIFLLPLIGVIPLSIGEQSFIDITFTNIITVFFLIILIALINLWFTGSLIHDVKFKKGFDKGIKETKKFYGHLILVSLVLFFLGLLSIFTSIVGIIISIAVDILFFFSIPSVIVNKDSFDRALVRSFNVVNKKRLDAIVFWLLNKIVSSILILIFFFLIISYVIFTYLDFIIQLRNLFINPDTPIFAVAKSFQFMRVILKNYLAYLGFALITSFGFAVVHVFNYISRTRYLITKGK